MRNKVKYTCIFFLFFILHYLEGLPPISGLSVAQLWKIPLLVALLIYNILSIRDRLFFEKCGYVLYLEYWFSPETLVKPFSVFIRIAKQLPLILFFGFWIHRYKNRKETLETILYTLAQYTCLSSIPFILGVITPLKEYKTAESFGVEGLSYFSGLFGVPHAASSYFCVAILVLVFGFTQGRFQTNASKIFNTSLIIIGLISIFKAYVRTGWIMLVVGLVFLLPMSRITYRQLTYAIVAIVIFLGAVFYLYNQNEAFHARITGKNVYLNKGGEEIDSGGSGRTSFWINGIEKWRENDLYRSLFGKGFTEVAKDNFQATGMEVFSHNQFIDTFTQNGLIGFLILILFNIGLITFIKQRQGHPYQRLGWAIFWSGFLFSFFQNEIYFNFAVIFSLVLALLYVRNE